MDVTSGFLPKDYEFMARALRLASRGLNTSTPNPRVGCVITRDEMIIGEGWHAKAGERHAEIHAIEQSCGDVRGGTAYVTLEPCAHHGKTPPCVDALIDAGIKRVVIGMVDPNPDVSGRGVDRLRAHDIQVDVGLMSEQTSELNVGFVKRMVRGTPWFRVKVAAGLDGKTALENGASQWITSEAARKDVHKMRARSCAVLTGVGTIVDDDPRMTVRHVETERQPDVIIVDSQLRSPITSKLFARSGVTVATAQEKSPKWDLFAEKGVSIISVPDNNGKVDLNALAIRLGSMQYNEILVEAGVNLHSALFSVGLIDELVIYYAPKFMGADGRDMLLIDDLRSMDQVPNRRVTDVRRFSQDLRVTIRF